MTKASAIGGTTRTVLNWIAQDRRRVHSVALTSQGEQQVPAQFADAVAATGGTVKIIDTGVPRLTDRARRLRAHMRGFDLVDLIPIPYDVVPWLASVDASALPPLLMVDHCDHMFWLGSSIADAIAHMREAGAALGRSSRGITADRQTLLPIPLELRSRTRDRAAAKAELGLPADAVVLLTVARRGKYKPVQTPGFFDLVDEVLRRHRQALLVAIGPSPSDPWIRLGDDTRDRVIALGERPASSAYFEAADVYLDSFPFASNTSLMEAGLLETPLVSCCRFDPEAEIMHPGAPGLDRSVIRATTGDEYIAALSALVESSERRREVGEQTRAVIAAAHCGEGWQRYLEEAYRFAASRPRQREVAVAAQHPDHDGPLGQALPGLALGFGLAGVAESHLDRQPATVRLPLLRRLRAIDPACSRSLALPRTIRRWIEKPAT